MNKDHSELIEYLDEKFSVVDERFDSIDKKFKETDKRLEEIEKRINQLVNSIDKLTKTMEIYHHEQVALSAKIDRLEIWVNQIAKQTGIELKP